MKHVLFVSALLIVAAQAESLEAQATSAFGDRTLGGGISASAGRNQGLTQSGQVSAEGAIQRDVGGFVGASTSNAVNILGAQQTGLGGLGGFGTTGLGGLGGFGTTGLGGFGNTFGRAGGGFGGQQNAQNLNNQTQTPGNLRIPLSLGFPRPPSVADASAASERLAEQLVNIRQVEAVGKIEVSAVGRTVVLRGTVATDHARSLAERVALLEPGVSEVRNELTVAQPDLQMPRN